MAVEIKELIIRAVANKEETPKVDNNDQKKENSCADPNTQVIVKACVQEVLRILDRRNRR